MTMDLALKPLSSLCSLIADCPHSTPKWTQKGITVLRNQNIRNGRLDLSSPSFTDLAHYRHRTRRAKPTAGDLVVTREAPMGEVCMIPEGLTCCLGQRMVLVRPNPEEVSPKYLLYSLQSPKVQHQISWSEGTGSTVSNLRIPLLENLQIPIPDLKNQEHIANILGALDDKIELNRRMSHTLEEIARTLFKSWFVDFDPVHAKAAGRQPVGMDAETASLFPSEFEDSELGLIPKGWRVSTIGEEVTVFGGSTPRTSTSEFWDGGTNAWATPKDLSTLQVPLLTSTERCITDEGVQQISSRQLPPGTLLMSSRAPVGYLAISQIPISVNQGFIAMVCDGLISSSHALWWAQENMAKIRGRANGTTFQEISKASFRPIQIIVPTPSLAKEFTARTRPFIERMALLTQESGTLRELRDTLLPRLMNGSIQLWH